MRLSVLAAGAALLVAGLSAPAEARRYEGSNRDWSGQGTYSTYGERNDRAYRKQRTARNGNNRRAHSGVGGRPSRWCGWWMRTQKGGGPEYNLAANWRNYGSSASAQVGAVVVWPHHVGMITGRAANGQWIVKSGNDGGRVRERARSVSGAVFRI